MGLEIKDAKTEQLAQEIAALTGESPAQAVTTALEERLARIGKDDRIGRLTEIARRGAEALRNAPGKPMTIEDLYDEETGLPK